MTNLGLFKSIKERGAMSNKGDETTKPIATSTTWHRRFAKLTSPLSSFGLGVLLLSGFTIAPSWIDAAAHQPVNPPCEPLAATVVFTSFQFTSATTALGQGLVYDGDVPVGTFEAHYFNIEAQGNSLDGNGVIQMNGQHTITFLDGSTLLTHDEILLEPVKTNPGWMQANSRLYIVDGTGAYAGATGLLHTHGEVNLFVMPSQGSIDVRGQVCAP